MTHRAEARRTNPVPAADLWQTVARMDGMHVNDLDSWEQYHAE